MRNIPRHYNYMAKHLHPAFPHGFLDQNLGSRREDVTVQRSGEMIKLI